jgi:hypothetical protein
MFPKSGASTARPPISTVLLSISFEVPSKGAFRAGSPHRAPVERDIPLIEHSFIHLLKSPVYIPPSRFPSAAPMEKDARLQSHIYISSRVSSNGVPAPLQVHLTERPSRETLVSRTLLQPPLKAPRENSLVNHLSLKVPSK